MNHEKLFFTNASITGSFIFISGFITDVVSQQPSINLSNTYLIKTVSLGISSLPCSFFFFFRERLHETNRTNFLLRLQRCFYNHFNLNITGTVTPQSSKYSVVCFGEVLWDILPSRALPGGAPMNVAYHLKKLGTNPALITKIGLDKYGEDLIRILTQNQVSPDFFYVDYENPTGLVYANTNDHHEVVYDIVYPSAWDFIGWKEEMEALVGEAQYFVYGSLTSRNKTSRDTLSQLLEGAKTEGPDINLRPPHFHRDYVEYLLEKADILKMNISELELITGWFSHFQTTEDRIKLMQDQFKIETLIVTMGGDGALVNHRGTIHSNAGFKVEVKDTIGSGDSFLAGFLHQLLNGAHVKKALAFASAIGAFIATQSGACPNYEMHQITDLINSNPSTKLETQF